MGANSVRWIVAIVAALAIVGLLAWARGRIGADDRIPDAEDAQTAVVIPGVVLL